MKKMPKPVAASMPPTTPVPTAIRLAAPAPVAMNRGTMPPTKANEVMMIGRNLSFTASSVASIGDLPSASSSIANSTKRIARSEEHTSELQLLIRISYAVFCLQKNILQFSQQIYVYDINLSTTDNYTQNIN